MDGQHVQRSTKLSLCDAHFTLCKGRLIGRFDLTRRAGIPCSATVKGKEKGKRKNTGKRIRPATLNRELACLKALFNHAIKSDVTFRNPVSRVDFLSENNEQTRVLTYDEQAKNLAAATPVPKDVATLMLETGMRPEEVYRIKPENVNLAGEFLLNPFGKTKAARRRVQLTAAARNVPGSPMAGLETPSCSHVRPIRSGQCRRSTMLTTEP